jgi:DHA2 family multidrug resistance protein-like MFS transporter
VADHSTSGRKAAPTSDGLPVPRRYWAVITLMSAMAVSTLDATVANVALPTIARDLSIDPAAVVWVVIAYSLMVVVSLLPLSAVAERIGFRRMFGLGITVFMLSSLGCALSTTLFGLVLGRVAQGFGASMLMCLFGGLVRNIYPLRKLGFGISLNAMVVGVMSVLGPTIGAFILTIASWPWIFAINVPICLLAYLGIRFLPDVPRNLVRFDWTACALSVVAFGAAIVGLDAIVKFPWRAAWCLPLAALAGWVLVRRSREQPAPLVPIDLLRIKPVAFAVAASGFSFAAQMASFVALPFYFQKVMGQSDTQVGLLLGVWSLAVAIMAPLAGVMSDKFPVAILCAIGAGCMAVGLGITAALPVGTPFVWMAAAMFFGGIGFGFFQTPNNRAMLAGAPRHRSGAAGGMQATTRVFGQSSGTALVAIAFASSALHGPVLGVVAAICCALAALLINIVRHMNPVADLEF